MHPLASAPLIGAQFAVTPVGIAGSGQTPNVGSGVSMRFITSPGNWDATRLVIPLGQSGDPQSPHFKGQFQAWLANDPRPLSFNKATIEKETQNVSILTPK
jgi:penicillin amidase